MIVRLPDGAFEVYFALGPDRSYQAVADKLGVSKKAVTRRAVKENWQGRIVERDRKTRAATEAKALESLEELNDRHLRILKAIQAKALEALKRLPLNNAKDAGRALIESIKQERLIRGEPTDRSAISMEETIRHEYDKWLGGGNGGDN